MMASRVKERPPRDGHKILIGAVAVLATLALGLLMICSEQMLAIRQLRAQITKQERQLSVGHSTARRERKIALQEALRAARTAQEEP